MTNLEESVFNRNDIELLLFKLPNVFDHDAAQLFLFVLLDHPNRIGTQDLVFRLREGLYLFDAGGQSAHAFEIEPDSSNKVIEVALGEVELDSFNVFYVRFKGKDNFEHEKESGGIDVSLLIFFLGQLPVSHNIPHDLILVDGSLLKLLVLEVHDFEEAEHLGAEAILVDAELPDDLLFYVGEGAVGLDFH